MNVFHFRGVAWCAMSIVACSIVSGQDWPQWGGSSLRNNTPEGKDIPTFWHPGKFDRKTGEWIKNEAKNIKWVARLGSQTYGNPVIADGRVYVGTNNAAGYLERYPNNVDLGCVLCFRESDGAFLWQYSSEKLATGRVHDWPMQGIVSAPLVEGKRLWFVNNRGEVVCADTEGFYDNEDDGPVQGVRGRLFTAQRNVTRNGAGYIHQITLQAMLESLGLVLPRNYRFESAARGPMFIVVGRQGSAQRVARLLFDGGKLHVARVNKVGEEETFEEVGSANTDLTAGLDEGKLGPTLHLLFKRRRLELPNKLDIRTVMAEKAWVITARMNGVVEHFELRVEDDYIVAHHLLPTTDKHEADVVWKFDMMKKLGVSQHNLATCCITSWGNRLFVCTSNGVDESHVNIPAPDAPSFIALDKHTGRLLWTDNSPGRNIMHGQWSAPAVAELGGVPQVIFPAGDGWVYSFRADRWKRGKPELLWKFDVNPKDSKWLLGGRGTRNNIIAIPVIYDGMVYVVVGQDPEHGEGEGHLWCIDPTKRGDVSPELVVDEVGNLLPHFRHHATAEWGQIFTVNGQEEPWQVANGDDVSPTLRKRFQLAGFALSDDVFIEEVEQRGRTTTYLAADVRGAAKRFRLQTTKRGSDVTPTYDLKVELETHARAIPNPNSAVVWHYDNVDHNGDNIIQFDEEFHRGIGSVAIKNDLLFVPDLSGLVHCLDAKTGQVHWTCDLLATAWGSPLIVEDKVYIGDEDGDIAIFELSSDITKSVKRAVVTGQDGRKSFMYEPRHELNMLNSVYSTPVVANNVLYIASKNTLFAIADDKIE